MINYRNFNIFNLINYLFIAIILYAIYTSFSMNFAGRSLWLDEAMLAYSFSERSIFNLTSDVFSWDQTAPVIYLYIVKIITLLFGNSEFTLRLWSFISYVLTIFMGYYILNKILRVKYPLAGAAFIANLAVLMLYSNEFKPYMSDCFAVLFLIVVYYLFKNKKINKWSFTIVISLIVWLSNPCCFFIGSILLIEFYKSIRSKDYSYMLFIITTGVIVLLSFILYYFYWLKPVINKGFMADFWDEKKFPLIPSSYSDLIKLKRLIQEIIRHFGEYSNLIFLIFCIGVCVSLYKKEKYLQFIYWGILITLFASMLGMYPIQDRLFLFIYPIISIVLFYSLDKVCSYNNNNISNIFYLFFAFCLLLSTNGISIYKNKNNVYRQSEETNFAIDYIKSNIRNEKVYIYYLSIPGFSYKNNFDLKSISNNENNIILGNDVFDDGKNMEDIDSVSNNTPIYILSSHTQGIKPAKMIFPLLDSLSNRGNLTLVYDKYNTNVYYYSNH